MGCNLFFFFWLVFLDPLIHVLSRSIVKLNLWCYKLWQLFVLAAICLDTGISVHFTSYSCVTHSRLSCLLNYKPWSGVHPLDLNTTTMALQQLRWSPEFWEKSQNVIYFKSPLNGTQHLPHSTLVCLVSASDFWSLVWYSRRNQSIDFSQMHKNNIAIDFSHCRRRKVCQLVYLVDHVTSLKTKINFGLF